MSQYADSGVSHEKKDAGLAGMVRHLRGTYGCHPRATVQPVDGYYASVIDVPGGPSLAISTDSVGTKVLVAQMAGKHDTIGIDCIAMNVNDVICVGADPVAMVDYIGVDVIDPEVFEQIGAGLAEGARRAEISIPGGEIAQVRDLVKSHGHGCHYDLIGTAVGVVDPNEVSDGSGVVPGDVVVGVASTGLHSNGFSLARKLIFETLGKSVDDRLEDCGRSVAEELLEPTGIYVRECKKVKAAGIPAHAMLNITGGGYTNLLRVKVEGVGFDIESLPEAPPIFRLLQEAGAVDEAEMHQVFNMGVGFAFVVPESHADAVIGIAKEEGKNAWTIGRVVADPEGRCVVRKKGLDGCLVAREPKGAFVHDDEVPAEHRS